MNETPTTTTRKRGRPATGITKSRPSLTIDELLMNQARRAAARDCMSVSAFVQRAIQQALTNSRP
jgi:post-segregation antitoxin (ccd killing protein)